MIKLLILSIIIQRILMEQLLPKGTFSFEINSLEKCPDPGTNEMIFNIRLSRQSMKKVNFLGNATMKIPLDKTIKVDYVFDKFGNGGWKVNAYVQRVQSACESLELFTGDVFRDMFGHCVEGECMKKKSRTPYCPVVSGVYEWRNIDVKRFTDLRLPGAFVGKWRFNIKLIRIKTNTLVGCFRTILTVKPKGIF